jgi:GntR family transcriptional repressor for pyruvate dehydrogenase complex
MFSVAGPLWREALRMLSAKGLVTIKKRSGIFVNDMTSTEAVSGLGLYLEPKFEKDYILHVFNIRQAIEPHICRWAAANRSTANIWEMEKNLLKMQDCPPEDREAESLLDQEFHQMVAAASKNPVVPLVLQPVFSLMPRIRAMCTHIPVRERGAGRHRRILDAIKQRDEEVHSGADHIADANRPTSHRHHDKKA